MNIDSIKAKLKKVAKDSDKNFLELFKQLTFERFLARVAISKYRENLIFKGGLCLRQYIETGRETKDIDFLAKKLGGELETIKTVFEEISKVDLEDFFEFHRVDASQLTLEHKKYPGYRIKIDLKFGNMKDRLQIDVGIGDVVDEYEIGLNLIKYKNEPLLGEGGTSLYVYPPEYIFSEKLHAIIELKTLNSRMKDYFDYYMLIQSGVLDQKKTGKAVDRTFKQRDTEFQLIDDYCEDLNPKWKAFINRVSSAPENIEEVIDQINDYCRSL